MDGETKRTEFASDAGEKLAAALDLPIGKPKAYALFAHCFSCTKDIKAARDIARALRAEGFAVMRFDFTGLGASEGEFANTNFSSNVSDLVKAADFLRDEFDAPAIMIGHSLGGAAVLVAASQVKEVQGVVTIAAPAEAAHVVQHLGSKREEIEAQGKATVQLAGRPFTIKKQFIDDLEHQNVINAAHNLDRPLLVLHAPLDQTVGVENASKIFVAAKHPKSFISLDTADHLLSDTKDAQYAAQLIASWAKRYIGDDAVSIKAGKSQAQPVKVSAKLPIPQAPNGGAAAQLMEGHKFATRVSMDGFGYTIDAGVNEGGSGLGPNPTRAAEAALAACGVMTMKMYALRKKWPLEDATITVEKARGEDAHQARILEKTYHMKGDLNEEQKNKLIEIADRCPVHKMLTGSVTIRKKQ